MKKVSELTVDEVENYIQTVKAEVRRVADLPVDKKLTDDEMKLVEGTFVFLSLLQKESQDVFDTLIALYLLGRNSCRQLKTEQ